jgi:hypothetical protein
MFIWANVCSQCSGRIKASKPNTTLADAPALFPHPEPKTRRLTHPLPVPEARNLLPLGMTRAAAASLRGLVGIAAAGRRRASASVQGRGAAPGWRGFRAVAPGSGGRTTPEPSSSSTPALPQLQPRRGLATRQTVLPGLISDGCER